MKISDLISELKERKTMYGDVNVEVRNCAGDFDEVATFTRVFGTGEIGYKKVIRLELDV